MTEPHPDAGDPQRCGNRLLDIGRLGDMLARIKGHITHRALERISPLAVPIMLEVGKESVAGEAQDAVLAEAAEDLIDEALGVIHD